MLKERCNRFAYFGLHRVIGSHLHTYYQEFLQLQTMSFASLRNLQELRLQKLLAHASTEIPFYRQRVQVHKGLALCDFPVLTKNDTRDNFENLMSPQILEQHKSAKQHWSYSWTPVQTGGSTGTPTTVIHDRDFRDFSRAARLYTQYLCGFPIGTPYFKLWGSMREINQAKGSLQQRVASKLAGEVVLNAFRMEDAEIDAYVQAINGSRIRHMMSYADAAYRLAEYLRMRNVSVRPLKSVMACAGTLSEEMRQSISKAFSSRVHNMYGSRDCGAMACECAQGALHILDNKVILETVDQSGSPVSPGQPGRILVTLLGNYGFPLIRYEIGDVGVLSDRCCDCGLPTRVLERVEGRSIEFLVTANGGYISPIYIRHLIGVVHNSGFIRRFQIVQYAQDHAVLALEKENRAPQAELEHSVANIRRDLLSVFGPGTKLDINLVDRIAESDSGKFICSINRIGRSNA